MLNKHVFFTLPVMLSLG